MIEPPDLDLSSIATIEELDELIMRARWTAEHLREGRYERACEAFEKCRSAGAAAAAAIRPIKAAFADDTAAKAAAIEFRAHRKS